MSVERCALERRRAPTTQRAWERCAQAAEISQWSAITAGIAVRSGWKGDAGNHRRSIRACTHISVRCNVPNARRAWSILSLQLSSGPHPHYRARTRLVHAGGGSSPCLSTRGGAVEFSACSGSRQRRIRRKNWGVKPPERVNTFIRTGSTRNSL